MGTNRHKSVLLGRRLATRGNRARERTARSGGKLEWARLVSNQGPLACEARRSAGANFALSRGGRAPGGHDRAEVIGERLAHAADRPEYWAGDVAGERGVRAKGL